ncbi:MAG: hypothetical protein GF320_02515, partial [Armatimonadia bacterium]|nr:hypothetical protein [Armatimonadia bacterium]
LEMVEQILASDPAEGQRVAALGVLEHIDHADAFELAKQYLTTGSPKVAQAAVAAVAAQGTPEADRILAELLGGDDPEQHTMAIVYLSERRTDEGAAALGAVVRDDRRPLNTRLAAAQALGRTATVAAVEALTASLTVDSGEVLAAVTDAIEDTATALAGGPGTAAARRAAERLLSMDDPAKVAGLSILARAPEPADVDIALRHMGADDPDVARAAIQAAVAVASELGRDEAISLLTAALEAMPLEAAALGVTGALEQLGAGADLAAQQGFLTDFHIMGPFPNEGGAGFGEAYPPEEIVDLGATVTQGGVQLGWEPMEVESASGIADLRPLVDPSENVVVYAYTEFDMPEATDAVLKLGSDDGIVAWLNGEKVLAVDAARPVRVDQDVAEVRLESGSNSLLLKITQGGGDFGFVARLVDDDGEPVL